MTVHTAKRKEKIEFGDFQTPDELACKICDFLWSQGVHPQSVVEPTCGEGSFLVGSLKTFNSSKKFLGFDINKEYMNILMHRVSSYASFDIELNNADFFFVNWQHIFNNLPEPILVIGNPPWVTNSELGSINSVNLPEKSNFQNHRGIDAITGKSNFDISEWMLIRLLECMQDRDAVLAMLCKTSVARKVLKFVWQNNFRIAKTSMFTIDTKYYFDVSVNACLFVCRTGNIPKAKQCEVFDGFTGNKKIASIGQHNSVLLADVIKHSKWSHFDGIEHYKWRSGVKHDCTKVMEFVREKNKYRNGLGELCDIEDDFLYPFFKSSDVAKDTVDKPRRWVLITQKDIGDDTTFIKEKAPRTWAYLSKYSKQLDNRKSIVYKGKPRFSIFGIGKYAFSQWKVAVSGLYKKIQFSVIAPYHEKPSMVDDTCYYISCEDEQEALFLAKLLNSKPAKEFFGSFIFWDSKRPITIDILRRLDLAVLADELGLKKLSKFSGGLPFK